MNKNDKKKKLLHEATKEKDANAHGKESDQNGQDKDGSNIDGTIDKLHPEIHPEIENGKEKEADSHHRNPKWYGNDVDGRGIDFGKDADGKIKHLDEKNTPTGEVGLDGQLLGKDSNGLAGKDGDHDHLKKFNETDTHDGIKEGANREDGKERADQ